MYSPLSKRPLEFWLPAFLVLLSMVLVVVAAGELQLRRGFADLVHVGQRLEKADAFDPAVVRSFGEEADRVVVDGICNSDIVRAGLTVRLMLLDLENPDVDYDAWASAVAAAERYAHHALRCVPTDGNTWLRFAMVRQAIGENSEETAALLEQSQRLAPSEGDVVFARLLLWNRLAAPTLVAGRDALRRDIQVACIDPTRLKAMRLSADMQQALEQFAPEKCRSMLSMSRPSKGRRP